jgi:hypothetical protein
MKAIFAAAALSAVLAPAWAADGGCAPASFGQEKSRKELCGRDACRTVALPADIARIRRGAYAEGHDMLAAFAKRGPSVTWTALDIDRALVLMVLRFPATDMSGVLERRNRTDGLGGGLIRRGKNWIDYIRGWPVPDERLRAIVCTANATWKIESMPDANVIEYDNDGYLYLVDGSTVRRFARPLTAEPKRLDHELRQLLY